MQPKCFKNIYNNQDFATGFVAGLIEARGYFDVTIKNYYPIFRFYIQLPITHNNIILFLKKYFGFGNVQIVKYQKVIIFNVGKPKYIRQIIGFLQHNYPIKTQKYILFKYWAYMYFICQGLKITAKNHKQFYAFLKMFKNTKHSRDRTLNIKLSFRSHNNRMYMSGFINALIDAKGFFDYRFYKRYHKESNYTSYLPQFYFYLCLSRNDYWLARMIKTYLGCGKLYYKANELHLMMNANKDIVKLLDFMDYSFVVKPRIVEYLVWSRIFYFYREHKPEDRYNYLPEHKESLAQLEEVYNAVNRHHFTENKLRKLYVKVKEIIDEYEKKKT